MPSLDMMRQWFAATVAAAIAASGLLPAEHLHVRDHDGPARHGAVIHRHLAEHGASQAHGTTLDHAEHQAPARWLDPVFVGSSSFELRPTAVALVLSVLVRAHVTASFERIPLERVQPAHGPPPRSSRFRGPPVRLTA